MSKLILIRHGQSVWNKENRFTGITDVELSEKGIEEAKKSSILIDDLGIDIDIAYTSNLKRAINTCEIILSNKNVEIIKDSSLNERDYGFLAGKNKQEIINEYGEYCIHKWRRGYYERPPNGENLHEVCNRVSEYFYSNISHRLKDKNILISAHGNSLRALFVVLGLFTKEEIEKVEIPTGKPYLIEFNKDNKIINNFYISPIKIKGRQILDSRGNPTVEVDVLYNNQIISRESCPSGPSRSQN